MADVFAAMVASALLSGALGYWYGRRSAAPVASDEIPEPVPDERLDRILGATTETRTVLATLGSAAHPADFETSPTVRTLLNSIRFKLGDSSEPDLEQISVAILTNFERSLEDLKGQVSARVKLESQWESALEQQATRAGQAARLFEQAKTALTTDDDDTAAQGLVDSAVEAAKKAREKAEVGYRTVHELLELVERTKQQLSESQQRMASLERKVDEIGEVIEVITMVASRTKLLALNASIIASQAGEFGASFNIVAQEVSQLARRATIETKDVVSRIESIHGEMGRARTSLNTTHDSLASGAGLGYSAGDSLNEMLELNRSASARVSRVARAVIDRRRRGRDNRSAVVKLLSQGQRSLDFSAVRPPVAAPITFKETDAIRAELRSVFEDLTGRDVTHRSVVADVEEIIAELDSQLATDIRRHEESWRQRLLELQNAAHTAAQSLASIQEPN